MRILCDHHVAPKYVGAFEEEPWLTVVTVAEALSEEASDTTISPYASAEGWVVFTNDTDFYRLGVDHGLLVYSQIDDPSPGDVVCALAEIDEAYSDHWDIREFVPGQWNES